MKPSDIISNIDSWSEIDKGTGNVYYIYRNGEELILKSEHSDNLNEFYAEARIQSYINQTVDFRVPKILDFGQRDDVNYILMDYIDGITPPFNLKYGEIEKTASNISWTIEQLQDIDSSFQYSGPLTFNNNQIVVETRENWREHVVRSLHDFLDNLPERYGQEADLISNYYSDNKHIIPEVKTEFMHGDLRFDNIIVNPDGSIRAVLDWGRTFSGDSTYTRVRSCYFSARDLLDGNISLEVLSKLFNGSESGTLLTLYQLHTMALEMSYFSQWYSKNSKDWKAKRLDWLRNEIRRMCEDNISLSAEANHGNINEGDYKYV